MCSVKRNLKLHDARNSAYFMENISYFRVSNFHAFYLHLKYRMCLFLLQRGNVQICLQLFLFYLVK